MKKKLLNEINRGREIMGLEPLMEQVITIYKFFRNAFKASGDVMNALQKTVLHKYGKKAGLVKISRIAKDKEMVKVLSDVFENTSSMFRNNGQFMQAKLAGAGVELTQEQAARLGKAWTDSIEAFNATMSKMKVAKKMGATEGFGKVLVRGGATNASGIQKPMVDALVKTVGAKMNTTDDLVKLLKECGMDNTKITKIVDNINEFGTIGAGKNLEEIFQVVIQNPSYQKEMVKMLKQSDEFNVMFNKGMDEKTLGNMIGLDGDNPITQAIYKDFADWKWPFTYITVPAKLGWTLTKIQTALQKLFGTKAGKAFLTLTLVSLGINFFYDQKWRIFGKKKAALTPDLYLDAEDNKEWLKNFGGLTDAEALKIANDIQTALEGSVLGPYDQEIVTIYEKIPSILACSQICYMWENKVDGTEGSLYNALIGLAIQIGLPRPLTVYALKDITIAEIKDTLETKQWTTSSSTTSKALYKAQLKKHWPKFPHSLTADNITWYGRIHGPILGDVLGELLDDDSCTGKSMEDCLRNMNPETFNAAFNTHNSNNTVDLYSIHEPEAIEDITESFYDDWLTGIEDSDVEGDTTLDKLMKLVSDQQTK